MKHIPIRQIMTTEVVAVRPETPLREAVARLKKHRIRAMPVVDDQEQLQGIFSETDVFLKERGLPFSFLRVPTLLGEIIDKEQVDQQKEAREVPVSSVMSRNVVTARESTTLEDLSMMMCERRLHCVPVTDEGTLRGIVTRIDVLQVIYGVGEG